MARLPNENIDSAAASTVKAKLSFCGRIRPYINDGDKIPVWDGGIYVYRSNNHTNDNLESVIPVQVKGHLVDSYTKKFSFFKVDLQKFLLKRSIFFFVVEFDQNNSSKIYYKAMHELDIQQILKTFGEAESKSLTLNELPEKENDIEKLLSKFGFEHNNYKFIPGVTSIGELIQARGNVPLSFSVDIPLYSTMEDFVNQIKRQQPCIIFIDKTQNMTQFMVDRIRTEHLFIKATRKIDISVGKKKHFANIQIFSDGDTTKYICNDKLFFRIDGDTMEWNYRLDGTYRERKEVNDFLFDLIQTKSFYVNGKEEFIPDIDKLVDVKQIINYHEFYVHFEILLKTLHIEKEPDFSSCTDRDFVAAENLYRTLILGEKFTQIAEKDTFNTFTIFGLKILVFIKNIDDYCLIKNWDENEYVGNILKDQNGKPIFSNIYFILACNQPNGFDRFDNINYEELNRVVQERINDKQDLSLSVLILLNLILMFDKTNEIRFLNHADELSKIISNVVKEPFCLINDLQIRRRKEGLSDADKSKIISLLETEKVAINKLAYYVLLDDMYNIERIYNELTDEERKTFGTWPISNLISKNKK